MKTLATAAILFLALAAPALAQAPAKAAQTDKGQALTDAKGMTLYTFDRDTAGTSNCNDQCATNWPPLAAPANAAEGAGYTVVTRKDGSKQWAYNGKPLYTWIRDQKPGDTTGDGVNNVWKIAKP